MARFRGSMAQQVLRLPMFAAGMPGRERLLARLSPEARAWMLSTLLPNEWRDEALAVELANAVAQVLNLATDEAIQQFFRRQHLQGFGGTFRQSGIRSPEGLFAAMPAIWSRQHDTGTLIAEKTGTNSGRIEIRHSQSVLDNVYGLALVGGTEAFLVLVGAQGARGSRKPSKTSLVIDLAWDGVATVPDDL